MKKFLSIILTLCLLFGMTSLVASATESDTETVYLYLDSADSLSIGSTGYTLKRTSYDSETVAFTGKYVLAGSVKCGVHFTESGTYDVTVHDLDAEAASWCSSFSFDAKNITVNLTAVGINYLVGYNHPGFTSNFSLSASDIENGDSYGTIKLTVKENSSILFNSLQNTTNVSVKSGITLTTADGSVVSGTENEGWRDARLVVFNGTPAAHKITVTETHDRTCSTCGFTFAGEGTCSDFTYTYIDETHCKKVCSACGKDFGTVEHSYYLSSDGDANGHIMKCYNCGHEKTGPHTYNGGYYQKIDSEHCAKECDICYYYDESSTASHDFSGYDRYDATYCVAACKHCGYYDSDNPVLQEHSFTKYYPYDSEKHYALCKYCHTLGEELSPHNFDDGVAVGATREHGEGTRYTCVDCGYSYITPDPDKSIIFTVTDENEDGWEGNAVVVYVDGVPTRVITNRELETEIYSMPYSSESSYVLKWISGYNAYECGLEICFPGSDSPVCEYDALELSDFCTLETIFSYNCADYEAVDEALERIPYFLEIYSAESVEKLVTAVKAVKRMLPASKQSEVDAMAAAVEKATNELVLLDTPVPNGFINLSSCYDVIINSDGTQGYKYVTDWEEGENSTAYGSYSYSGKYTFFETGHDDFGEAEIIDYGIWVGSGNVEIETVNMFISGAYGTLSVLGDSNVTLTPVGANAFDSSYTENAGIAVSEDAKLTINDSDGSILAIGADGSAGIGGVEDEHGCGDIHIKGSTVFALSIYDGAGIGGGEDTSVGTITIDGGVVHAECLYEDGAGIGQGNDGVGGDIIINGGDIVALCVSDDGDGAGIGGADDGCINSITINGGNIIAGSMYGAAIGGGYDSDYCGKITVNGGTLSQSIYHYDYHCFIGHSYGDEDYEESEKSFVQINGGIINESTDYGIVPAPTNKDGKVLEKLAVTISSELVGENVTITLSDGTKIKVNADSESFTVYAPEGTSVSDISLTPEDEIENPTDPSDPSGDDDDDMFWLWKFFIKIFNWFGSVFQAIGDFFKGLFIK